MPNGKSLINEMDYQGRIKAMGDRELSEFTAMQIYETCITLQTHDKRIHSLEKRGRKTIGFTGGLGAFAGAIIAVLFDFFARR